MAEKKTDSVARTTNNTLDQKTITALRNARMFMDKGELPKALWIYKNLVPQEVPEAMYQYGVLALQNRNANIGCTEAVNYLVKASNKEYIPARRTLGFLYAYASNSAMMQQYEFTRCNFNENKARGSRLLMEATLQGDTMAARLLEQLNRQ